MPEYTRRSARAIVLDRADRVLLLRSALDPGDPSAGFGWFTPGGGVEPGEDIATTAARELAEEIGLTVPAPTLRWIASTAGPAGFDGGTGYFRDDFLLLRVDRHDVDTSGQTEWERRHYGGHHWWTVPDLHATTEIVYPAGLAALLTDTITGNLPPSPVELPWQP
ncbi:NUDIX hydrolase [Actinoplanes utahensis]|uniref:RNA pyrophosphohydrolase n=1 Tax=Actinoplanes utahensis TaxID=1869 RepID=A0A0A6UDF8_ACTUT|nr:NUDIX domain-containing protein [Actinoplanes utahensis]KHD73531.1 RNA pyrophosphohydrolase [Actinoplanes utahensis]GIF33844.1 DNA mismatch repair protein MutT [Actinoplanes utahensis]